MRRGILFRHQYPQHSGGASEAIKLASTERTQLGSLRGGWRQRRTYIWDRGRHMDWLHLLLDGYPAATDPSSLSTWRRVETPVMFYGHDTCEDTTSYCSLWARRMGGGYVPKGCIEWGEETGRQSGLIKLTILFCFGVLCIFLWRLGCSNVFFGSWVDRGDNDLYDIRSERRRRRCISR